MFEVTTANGASTVVLADNETEALRHFVPGCVARRLSHGEVEGVLDELKEEPQLPFEGLRTLVDWANQNARGKVYAAARPGNLVELSALDLVSGLEMSLEIPEGQVESMNLIFAGPPSEGESDLVIGRWSEVCGKRLEYILLEGMPFAAQADGYWRRV